MTDRKLDDWIDGFLKYTENSEPAATFRLWTAISVIAGCLQRKCRLEWGTLTFFPNLYVVLVAPPGGRKGTAMDPGLKMIEAVGVPLASESITREALIRELKETSDMELSANGVTDFHCSLTVYAPELVVFLGYGNDQLMSDLCDWFDCRARFKYRTKTQGTDTIKGVFVNILGGTTPELLRNALPPDAVGSGLTSRIIFVYEPGIAKPQPFPFLSREGTEIGKLLLQDLEHIRAMRGKFSVTEAFLVKWEEWYMEQYHKPPFQNHPRLQGYVQRRPPHLLKLSMIMSASRSDSMIITDGDLLRAKKILELTERKMPQTFAGMGRAAYADVLNKVMADVGMRKQVTMTELTKRYMSDADPWTLDKVVDAMRQAKFAVIVNRGDETVIWHKKTYDEERKKKDGNEGEVS
jgi:hypothetical protein